MQSMLKINSGKIGKSKSLDQVYELMNKTKYYNILGEEVSAYDIWSEAVRKGVFSGGLHYNEYHMSKNVAKLGNFEAELLNMGFLPSSEIPTSFLYDNKLLRGGRSIGENLENFWRLSTFITEWKKGAGFDGAAMKVKQMFYDYRDLNMFERNVLRRWMPFYSWSRFNVPRMIETVFTKPMVHYRVINFFKDYQREVVGGPIDESAIPDWIKKRYGITVIKNDDGSYIFRTLDTLIPLYEAYPFFTDGPIDTVVDKAASLITPILKIPFEALVNKSLYTEQPIEDEPGEPSAGFTYSKLGFTRRPTNKGALGLANLILNDSVFKGVLRPVDTFVSLIDAMLDDRTYSQTKPFVWAGLLDIVLGKSQKIDLEKTREWIYTNWEKTERAFINQYEYALKHGDEQRANFFIQKLNELRLTRPPEKK